MAYIAIVEARKAAEAKQNNVLEAVRLGLQIKRETDAKKAAQDKAHAQAQTRK